MGSGIAVGLCVLVAGCYAKPDRFTGDIDAAMSDSLTDATSDAFVPSPCQGIPFEMTPTATFPLVGAPPYDPAMNPNLLELFFVEDPGGAPAMDWDIGVATRMTTGMMFVKSTSGVPFNSGTKDTNPSLTADGSILVFVSDRSGSNRGYQVTRTGTTWGPVKLMPGLEANPIESLDISADGLTLYFMDAAMVLHRATRMATGDAFADTFENLGSNFQNPTVSFDGNEIFYDDISNSVIGTAERTTGGFGPRVLTNLAGYLDPDMLPSGEDLVVLTGAGIAILHRNCP